ncbi:MAG: PQQ-binding-like beta-propeller repeat protein [Planctomycetota bacterium]|nr:PQQ-binding-like beta-propeller repeat protein [Planctomycetota bacterium]
MLANELINRLERLGLLDQEIIEALREQLDQGGARVTPEAVAKLLVDNGQLTHFQATKLIGELRSGEYEENLSSGDGSDLNAGLDDLDLVPEDVDEAVVVVEDDEPVEVMPVEAMPVEAVPVEAMPVEAMPVEAVTVEGDDAEAPQNRPVSRRKKPDPEKSVWDSFKIYGYVGIIALLMLIGAGITFVLTREDADEFIAKANEFYDQQNYQGAQDMYLSYLDRFGEESEYASVAKTRVTMTELYKAAQFKQEPWRAVDLAKEKLPLISEEKGMNEERDNLSALLVDIAANLAESAGRAKETVRKQELLDKLDEHRELMESPFYMSATAKVNLENQIKAVEEARARVQRDINRNIRLDQAEASMQASLERKETKETYDTRKELLRDFPELRDHERLVTLIRSASNIQQTLVKPSAKLPKTISGDEASDSLRTIVLTAQQGQAAPDLRGETIYIRAGGSVLAFDGENGSLRWRKYVGNSKDLPPVRLEDGVLLSDSASLEVLRCGALDGKVAWRSQIGEQFPEPITVGDEVYVAGESGRLICVDGVSGDAKWATQIPQSLDVGPGIDSRADRAYQVGNHSNLYVLNTRDGSCLESFYVGHDEGTITVPPVSLLGHLFVIENATSDFANVHILRLDESGGGLKVAQPLLRLTGNVRVTPIIQGRRLIVLTDRGEVKVLDIEPTAEREQVTVAASLPAFYDQPTATQMAVGRAQMWITGTRLGRYELQINTGRVIRDWSIHELDTFISQPYATDDALVHARMLRDTSAIRVTAANPKTGEEIWRTDVGVPVSAMTRAPEENGLHVVTSQAALFDLDGEAINGGSTTGPIENPGDQSVAIRFEDPIAIDDERFILINAVDGRTTMVYEPQRPSQKLRKVRLQLSSGRPSGGALVAGGGLVLPLDTGRVVLMQWRNGSMLGAPFQPASDPVGSVRWTRPLALPDDSGQVVLADSRKKIYRLRIAEQIRELSSKEIEFELLGPAAAVGSTMIATAKGPSSDFVIGYDMATLDKSFQNLLQGRVVWGPIEAGDQSLIQTNDSILRGIAADGGETFQVELPVGRPVGKPLLHEGKLILSGSTGWIVVIDPAAGKVVGSSNLGQPLSATPYLLNDRLMVPGAEGVVYDADIPAN